MLRNSNLAQLAEIGCLLLSFQTAEAIQPGSTRIFRNAGMDIDHQDIAAGLILLTFLAAANLKKITSSSQQIYRALRGGSNPVPVVPVAAPSAPLHHPAPRKPAAPVPAAEVKHESRETDWRKLRDRSNRKRHAVIAHQQERNQYRRKKP